MGNLSFLIPTKNQEDFNRDKIASLISENFKNLKLENDTKWDSIQIYDKDILVTDLYFNQDCYLIDFDRDIELLQSGDCGLSDEESFKLVSWMYKLKELNTPKDSNEWNGLCLQMTYGQGATLINSIRSDIEFFLRDYFEGYIFDEGIHPEFMPPDYIRYVPRKKVSSFKTFLSKFL